MTSYPAIDTSALELRAIANFRRRVAGELILRGEPGYPAALARCDARADRCPGFIVRPRDARDVDTAVAFARAFDLPLIVRGDGDAQPLCNDGVVVDLSGLAPGAAPAI